MGRKTDAKLAETVLQAIRDHNGQLRPADLAKQLHLHPYQVSRLLPAIDAGKRKWLCEDDEGRLSLYRDE